MAKLTKEEFISSLKEMNLLEIKELVDAMKEEFGVIKAQAPIAIIMIIVHIALMYVWAF